MPNWINIAKIILKVVVIGFFITLAGVNIVKAADINQDLIKAADDRRWERVKRILNEGADVNGRGGNRNYTALMLASKYGELKIVKLLLEKGADINAKDNRGYTPLSEASIYGQLEVAKLLLEKGANVNAKDNDGVTCLLYTSPSPRDS